MRLTPTRVVVVVGLGLVVAGFVAIGITYAGVSRTLVVGEQVAFAVSGGAAALAAVAVGLSVLSTQLSRREDATEARLWDELSDRAADLAADLGVHSGVARPQERATPIETRPRTRRRRAGAT